MPRKLLVNMDIGGNKRKKQNFKNNGSLDEVYYTYHT